MKQRISLVTEAHLLCEELIILTASQREKLENEQLRQKIDNLAKDMRISSWVVENNGNVFIAAIGKEFESVIGSEEMHEVEIVATNFMGAIDKLELPTDPAEDDMKDPNLIHFDDGINLDFVKSLLADLNLPIEDEEHVIGAQILCYGPKNVPFPLPWGKMSYYTLKEMCELYIKEHDHE